MTANRIDVHSHFVPPGYRDECERTGNAQPDGMRALPQWNVESHLEVMEQNRISKSILSISTPGTHLAGSDAEEAARLTAYCNDQAASLKKNHPDKFGFWASLPVLDVDLALKEIERAHGIGADGFCLLTNTHGHYLGDSVFDKIFEELNKRKATVFIHPTTPCILCDASADPRGHMSAAPLAGRFASPVFEFMFDTARMVANMFTSGTVARTPDITFIIPHLGGAMPPILSRFTGFSAVIPDMPSVTEQEVREAFQRQFFFDLAGFAFPTQIVGLVRGVGVDHKRLLYGSDYPFTPAAAVRSLSERLNAEIGDYFSADQIMDVLQRNAGVLLRDSLL